MEINLKSEVFNEMLLNLDTEIRRVLEKIYTKEFESGEITLKIGIDTVEKRELIPTQDGDDIAYDYVAPNIKHNITTNLKQQFKRDGFWFTDEELKQDDGKFYTVPIEKAQLDLFRNR